MDAGDHRQRDLGELLPAGGAVDAGGLVDGSVDRRPEAALVINIMNGKLTQTLKMQTVIAARVGSARNSSSPKPKRSAQAGIGLCGWQPASSTRCGHHDRHDPRQHQQDLEHCVAGDFRSQQQRQAHPDQPAAEDTDDGEDQGEHDGLPERRAGEDVDVIGQTHELASDDQGAVTDRLQRGNDQRVGVDQQQQSPTVRQG